MRDSSYAVERWPTKHGLVSFRGIDGRELARQYALNLELSNISEGARLEHQARRKMRTARADGTAGGHHAGLQGRTSEKRPLSERIADLLNMVRTLAR